MVVLESGALVMLLLELAKYVVGKIKKVEKFNFSPEFFTVAVPVLNAVMPFFLVYVLGQSSTDPILSMDLVGVIRYVISVALGSLVSLFGYSAGLKPLKTYATEFYTK